MNMNEFFFHLFISFSIHICTTVGWRLRKCFQNMLFCDLGYCALLLNLLIPDFKRAAKHRLELFPLPHPYPYPEFLQVVPLYHKQCPYTTGGHSSLSCPCLQAAPAVTAQHCPHSVAVLHISMDAPRPHAEHLLNTLGPRRPPRVPISAEQLLLTIQWVLSMCSLWAWAAGTPGDTAPSCALSRNHAVP